MAESLLSCIYHYLYYRTLTSKLPKSTTFMRIIKLKLFPVPVRLLSGASQLKVRRYFTIFCDI